MDRETAENADISHDAEYSKKMQQAAGWQAAC